MADIYEAGLICEECDRKTKKILVSRSGFELRAWQCPRCEKTWIHPTDKEEYENFQRLKNKTFEVKLRLVGNSYTVSIPREIIEFEEEMHRQVNKMVRMSLDDPERLTLFFTRKSRRFINE